MKNPLNVPAPPFKASKRVAKIKNGLWYGKLSTDEARELGWKWKFSDEQIEEMIASATAHPSYWSRPLTERMESGLHEAADELRVSSKEEIIEYTRDCFVRYEQGPWFNWHPVNKILKQPDLSEKSLLQYLNDFYKLLDEKDKDEGIVDSRESGVFEFYDGGFAAICEELESRTRQK